MRKELIVAVLLGSVLGLGVAFGIWRTNAAIKGNKPTPTATANVTQTTTTSVTTAAPTELTIASPLANSVSAQALVQIQGMTQPDTLIPVYAEGKDYLTKADASGNFTVDTELLGGINNLQVDGKSLIVVYSASSSAQTAILGVVTDKTENSVQLRDSTGQIQQVAISPDTTYVRIGKTATESDFDDLGIGDYIAATGSDSSNNGFNATRIIMTTAPEIEKRKILRGTVSATSAREITFSYGDNQTAIIKSTDTPFVYDFDGTKSVRGKFGSIEEEDQIIALGLLDGTYLDTRTIFVLPTPQ